MAPLEEKNISETEKPFLHGTLEERTAEYGGKISICPFDEGGAVGRELL